MPATNIATAARRDLNARLISAMGDLRALNKTRGPLGHGVIFHADKDQKAAELNTRIAGLRADLDRLA